MAFTDFPPKKLKMFFTAKSCVKWLTASHHIMAHASNWHKTEVKIFNNNGSLSPTLTYFCLTNKEVEVMTEIIYISSAISVCKLCQFKVHISCRNYIIAP